MTTTTSCPSVLHRRRWPWQPCRCDCHNDLALPNLGLLVVTRHDITRCCRRAVMRDTQPPSRPRATPDPAPPHTGPDAPERTP